jgi:pentatricopeptide repeat protein
MAHGVAVRRGMDVFVIVTTDLVHAYAAVSELISARAVFERIADRNMVTWNVMLNGYVKAGMMGLAEELLSRTPERDVVSWLTIIHGYICSDLISNALKVLIHMLGEVDVGNLPINLNSDFSLRQIS